MYTSLAAIIARFDLELFDTNWERDLATQRDCFLGNPNRVSKGIRVRVLKDKGGFDS
jgi:hypothetical protein